MIGTLLPDLPVQQPPLQLLQPVRLQPVWLRLRLVRLVHGIILRLLLPGNQKEDGKEQLRRLKVRLQSLVGTGDGTEKRAKYRLLRVQRHQPVQRLLRPQLLPSEK